MAIRIRKVDGHMIALCAAKTKKQKGDIYLDDNLHQVLGEKFYADYVKMGFIKKEKPPQVTEEWIEEKAKRLASMITDYMPYGQKSGEPFELNEIKNFIRSLVEKIRGVEIVEK